MPPPLTSAAVANHNATSSYASETQFSPLCHRVDRNTTGTSKDSSDIVKIQPVTPCSSNRTTLSQPRSLARLLTSPKSLKGLMRRHRRSSSSTSVVSTVITSPLSNAFCPSTPTTVSITSPLTPQSQFSPVRDGKGTKANLGIVSHSCISPITPAELSQIWSHAIHLANMQKHQSARLVFKHLMSRHGLPPYYLPLLAMNAGLLMLREQAPFPALHMFYTIAQQMCPTGPISLLAFFAVGVSAWGLAHANSNNVANDDSPDRKGVPTVSEQTLLRARDFFSFALNALDGVDEFNYNCFGFDFKLSSVMIRWNRNSCDSALRQLRNTSLINSLSNIRIEKLPHQALFMPIELKSGPEISEGENSVTQLPQFGIVRGMVPGNKRPMERSMSDGVLTAWAGTKDVNPAAESAFGRLYKMKNYMKPLPPLPPDPLRGYVRRQ